MTADNVIRKILLINRSTNWNYKECRRKAFLEIDDLCTDYLGLTEDLDCELLCEDIEKMIIDKDWMDKYIGWKSDLNKSPVE
tara:strand:+ start:5147 stop:5392 length:246 start_codon:yes stop_codon:yes gene_type:complete